MGAGERGLTRLIVTADDFGLAEAVNEAVERAHREGILTTASLMVGAPHADDAVRRARLMPGLAVGLHLVVARGKPVLPPTEIPDLVDDAGRLNSNLVRAGFRYFFLPRVRRQLQAEIRAQFDAFRATGLKLDHVNAHNHMHLHPTVLSIMLRVGGEYGMRAVRLPAEPVAAGGYRGGALLGWLFLRVWIALMKARLKRAGIAFNRFLLGLRRTGAMDARRVRALLAAIPAGDGEIFFHPATGGWRDTDGDAANYRPADELAALIDPTIRKAIDDLAVRLIAFRDLG